ncbi:GMC family oxidoreductase N-terminal domain-containing protein [Kordia sp.]|uniref:GMC family oxidoreductase N-terminal domain-containing protein n=1 Tax=Kordia sp. TaxID=1965332 RepID=UPI0025C1F459|nr:GMC family oxidoreductase N-terminal domain-containing protein [Kordia sp.]MCH2193530.1 GMC family oxidoreductase N-terminal domain-containing protein [Kordia sp.]
MTQSNSETYYDVIIVGSGTCGATLAKELTKQNKKILILEKGATVPLKETLPGIAPLLNEIKVTNKLKDMRAITTGGTTAFYFAVAAEPPLETFSSLGIDLAPAYEETVNELPINYLPDDHFGPQSLKLRDSALDLGHTWEKQPMLVDLDKCNRGYSYEAKWKAKRFVEEALDNGAILKEKVEVTTIIFEGKKAVGVTYKEKKKSNIHKVFGEKIILAAGILASPKILQKSGINNIGSNGFYIDPNRVYFGLIPKLKSVDNFVGAMETKLEEDIFLGDANVPKLFYKLLMISTLKFRHFFSFSKSIGIGVKVHDPMSGSVSKEGDYRKTITDEVLAKLDRGGEEAIKILKNAGAKHIVKSPVNVTSTGGLLQINEHVDSDFQTEYKNLYVCDRSILPDTFRKPPTLTLVCMAKYLANRLCN